MLKKRDFVAAFYNDLLRAVKGFYFKIEFVNC